MSETMKLIEKIDKEMKQKKPFANDGQRTAQQTTDDNNNIPQKLINNNPKELIQQLKEQVKAINSEQDKTEIIEYLKPVFEQMKSFDELDREAFLLDIKERFGFTGDMLKTIKKTYFYADISTQEEDNTVIVEELDPYSEQVSGLDLANEIEDSLKMYSFMSEYNYTAVTLWIMLTYIYKSFDISPKLLITSPTKRCGKTTLLTAIEGMVYKSIVASNITPAAFFRLIDKYQPTILIDEADTGFAQNDDLKGIVNAGHTKRTAFVIRVADKSKDFEPERFNVFVPQVISMIGDPYDTLLDRSVIVSMERKPVEVKLTKLDQQYYENNKELRQKLLKWANDNVEALVNIKVDVPDIGNDRAIDNWKPLFSIASLIGGDWLQKANKAMLEIEAQNEDADFRMELLKDVKAYFEEKEIDKVKTKELVEYLNSLEDKPYADFGRGVGITPARLSKLLRAFKIKPKTIRIYNKTAKGYNLEQFKKTFERYISPEIKRNTVTMAIEQQLQENKNVTPNSNVTFCDSEKMATEQECYDVTATNGGYKEKTENDSLTDKDNAADTKAIYV